MLGEPAVLNSIVERDGAFRKETIWVRGHLVGGEHIQGWTGPETVFIRRRLMASVIITVLSEEEKSLAAA